MDQQAAPINVIITVLGIVQGVGMRPFVARLAERLGIAGSVCNAGAHVVIEASGSSRQIDDLLIGLRTELPPAAQIVRITVASGQPAAADSPPGFRIVPSRPADGLVMISPDLAICPDCQRELLDPQNRRFDHALISCMHCGPRYSILEDLPYDRQRTTLQAFPMCPACQDEYERRDNRRYHAQTVSCPDCGPQLSFQAYGQPVIRGSSALLMAVGILKYGGVLAIKGIGGYHLACRPDLGDAVARLRRIKMREEKPFAVLFPDLESLRPLAFLNQAEISQLESPPRPIVLLTPAGDGITSNIHPLVCAGSRQLGAFLPATPLQVQLTGQLGPLVMTSANLSGDVICIDDDDMQKFAVSAGLDGVLSFDRRIVVNLDDSVLRLVDDQPLLIRRARGFVPLPVDLSAAADPTPAQTFKPRIAAAGGDLKATPALTRDNLCYLGAPVGDLSEMAVSRAWQTQLAHLSRLLNQEPDWLVADQHPDYLSSRLLREQYPQQPLLTVQHHQAHIASVLAENPGVEAVLGVAMDGTGFGSDGSIWGGEWLVCRGETMTRAACLKPIPFAGGDQTRKRAWQCLANHLAAVGPTGSKLLLTIPCLSSRSEQVAIINAACRRQIGTVLSSSMGSLFDAVSALLGLGENNQYEGQCAQALEMAAAEAEAINLPVWPLPELTGLTRTDSGLICLDPTPLFTALATALFAGADPRSLALAFHEELAEKITLICVIISGDTGLTTVALSGGCFQNALLLKKSTSLLRQAGLTVLTNRQVPPGDGGLALGQAWLASRMIAGMADQYPPGRKN